MPKRLVASGPPFVSPFGYGKCFCGCGEDAPVANRSDSRKGYVKGYPKKFVHGHHRRPPGVPRYTVNPNTGCWEWQWNIGKNGYGYTAVEDERGNRTYMQLAHRVFYEEACGPIPKGMHLHHTCQTKHCVNPDHLEPLTPAQHTQDRAQKLEWESVREIRRRLAAGETNAGLADEFGLTARYVAAIKSERVWREPVSCPNCSHRFDPYD